MADAVKRTHVNAGFATRIFARRCVKMRELAKPARAWRILDVSRATFKVNLNKQNKRAGVGAKTRSSKEAYLRQAI